MLVSQPVDYESTNINRDDAESNNKAVVEVDSIALFILDWIERLLPDPVKDNEAHKSAWDIIMDLHGCKSVRVSEESLQREGKGGGSRWRRWRRIENLCEEFAVEDALYGGARADPF